MKIKNLYIKDFGIFNNQKLDNLNKNVVVIGGLNRAGKTTFLKMLRYLGYGFPRGGDLPPARNQYEVEGELILGEDAKYSVLIRGYSEPKFNYLEGKTSKKPTDIFNDIDLFTYKQLFTLSLDELKRLPQGVNDNETERLQSILLGAGLSDMITIPRLEEEFLNEAEKVGGKNGNPSVKKFKPYYKQIKEGLKLREEANSQLAKYKKSIDRLEDLKHYIKDKEYSLRKNKFKLDRLDVLKNNYRTFENYKKLQEELSSPEVKKLLNEFPIEVVERVKNLRNTYTKEKDKYSKLYNKLAGDIENDKLNQVIKILYNYRYEIEDYYSELSGMRERVNNYFAKKENTNKKKIELIKKASDINKNWKNIHDFEKVKSLETDILRKDKLNQYIVMFNEKNNNLKQLIIDKNELEEKIETKKKRLKELKVETKDSFISNYFYIGSGITILGLGLIYFLPFGGLIMSLTGIGGLFLFALYRRDSKAEERRLKSQYEEDIIELKERVKLLMKKINRLDKEIKKIESKIKPYKESLDLDQEVHPEILRDYFREVKQLKKDIIDWEEDQETLHKKREKLVNELTPLNKLLENFNFLPDINSLKNTNDKEIISQSDLLLNQIERLYDYKKKAVSIYNKQNNLKNLEKEIIDLIGLNKNEKVIWEKVDKFLDKAERFRKYKQLADKLESQQISLISSLKTDRVKKSLKDKFGDFKDEESQILLKFSHLFEKYISLQEVKEEYEKCNSEIEKLNKELKNLRNEKQSCQDEIKKLSASSKLQKAQSKIDNNRNELRRLAEKYAVNQTAAFLLGQLRKRFINNTKDRLFSGASQLFQQMTEGEYKNILPTKDLIEPDFRVRLKNNQKKESTDLLSRGTKEQLFLAVRLSRIKQIDHSLPLIIDDTLVNFDRYHLSQSLNIISDIAKTNQIFILTCHPHFIKHLPVTNKKINIDYWKLNKGNFTRTNKDSLINYLTC